MEPEVDQALTEIERQVWALRGEPLDYTPWDFNLPTGSDLRYMREQCGLSTEEFADMMDYSAHTVLSIETGNKAPGREFIQTALLVLKREWPRGAEAPIPGGKTR